MATAATLLPSAEAAIDIQFSVLARAVQLTPLLVEVQIWPPKTTAARLLPSADEAIDHQFSVLARAVQVTPLSAEGQIWPPEATAASLLPSVEDAIPRQFCVLARAVQTVGWPLPPEIDCPAFAMIEKPPAPGDVTLRLSPIVGAAGKVRVASVGLVTR